MRCLLRVLFFLLTVSPLSFAKVVVFWQAGFPTIESQPIARATLATALGGMSPVFANLEELKKNDTLRDVDLLVLPYGSAVPIDAWPALLKHLEAGGNLLTLGGRALFVPVRWQAGRYVEDIPQATYARHLGLDHSYPVPQKGWTKFAWEEGYDFSGPAEVRAENVYVLGMGWGGGVGDYHGIGYLLNARGEKIASPVVSEDFRDLRTSEHPLLGARCVFLNFTPQSGYWESSAGITLVRNAAAYASRGATIFYLEMLHSTVMKGEIPQVVVHFRNVRRQRLDEPQQGTMHLELLSGSNVLASADVPCSGGTVERNVVFDKQLVHGLYSVRGRYTDGAAPGEFYQTGFWVHDESFLTAGPVLAVGSTYFKLGDTPFIPFGTNYFSTDPYRQVFIGSGNAYYWDQDFAEMAAHGVTFIRTGVWNRHIFFLNRATGSASEGFLRNLEAFVLSAARHHIHVNFTFFAFDPQTTMRRPGEESLLRGPGSNPYTDPISLRTQEDYVLSVVSRFKDVPWLSWDLINEPSFSNPQRLWIGNTPNNDPTEVAAWNKWLEGRYGNVEKLAELWQTAPSELGAFGSIPLPDREDIKQGRMGSVRQLRALDYNLFAQAMFNRWAESMIKAIRSTGSQQLVDVGQDEGGVADRVLNQFYGASGVAFTVNHTYWRLDALLWDSFAAKRPGMPNLIGETGYQPVNLLDGDWRLDEVTGFPMLERRMALGFASANSGSLQWDWSPGDFFGTKRSDGSDKIWEEMMRGMGEFAKKTAPYAIGAELPQVAIVLPQSFQLSAANSTALEAQQASVRALYNYARASAYAVGEYQITLLGNPKLIILASPTMLADEAWQAILAKVRAGATLLVTGRFDADPHYRPTDRATRLGLDCKPGLLLTREAQVSWPGGSAWLSYGGDKILYLDRAYLASGQTFQQVLYGQGKVLYVPLPIELNDNLAVIGEIYRYALDQARVARAYSTDMTDPGLLVCPTRLPKATLYVITSESASSGPVRFRDAASGEQFSSSLEPGRAALLLVGHDGTVLASYDWRPTR